MKRTILHLSDIHLGTMDQAQTYRTQLEADLKDLLEIGHLDYLVVSGDMGTSSKTEEYKAATDLLSKLCSRYKLASDHLIIVPGNHDLNWDLSKAAYKFIYKGKDDKPPAEGTFIPAGDVGDLVRDDSLFPSRFVNFSNFIETISGSAAYPLKHEDQWSLSTYPKDRLLFLGLNSSWEIDHHYRKRQCIDDLALSNAFDQLSMGDYRDWFKIAVFHHPVTGEDNMNAVFLQQLAIRGFQACLHGHIHEAQETAYRFFDHNIHIIGAGTFGALTKDWVPGIPLQYNFLILDTDSGDLTVETRKREKPGGAWVADSRWGDDPNNPVPRYTVQLRNHVPASNKHKAEEPDPIPEIPVSYADPGTLRTSYLNRVFENAGWVDLSGIDRKAAKEDEARLNLSQVYTALLTLDRELIEKAKGKRVEEIERGETRPLSALEMLNRNHRLVLLGDPGSGKSTFVNFVAMCLAGEVLGLTDANLKLLTEPIPQTEEREEGKKKAPARQPWDCEVLLPLRVILRDFAGKGLPPIGEKAGAEHLWQFIAAELKDNSLGEYGPHLKAELQQKGGLLLLDGLDEVPEADERRVQIKQAVEGFAQSFPHCRILVTSRTYAYQKQDWRLANFTDTILAPFERPQIAHFVRRWYDYIAVLRSIDHAKAKGDAELLEREIFRNERLFGLAERPLLLTLMASLHAWRSGTLPEKREQLYNEAVDLLLDWWERPKKMPTAGGSYVLQPSLIEWLNSDRDQVRALLNRLAYEVHAAQPDLSGTGNIPEKDLVDGLLNLSQNPDVKPRRLIEYLSTRAGLLIAHGNAVYTFPHRTFQEYLAACHLTDHDYPDQIAKLACDDFNRWREVALLAGAKAARGTASAIWNLVDALCFDELPEDCPEARQWGAHLAGMALVESANLANLNERLQKKLERVRRGLVHILQSGRLPALERCLAGDNLARLGDPRFSPLHWHLPVENEPRWGFVEIAAGTFLMGSNPDKDNNSQEREQPQHEVNLTTYYMARYPVTGAQYRQFVQESDHKPVDADSLRGLDNHPVMWVTWHEARAYADWLDGKLRASAETPAEIKRQLEQGWTVRLPSEAEWEKAARGMDGRIYPWEGEFDADKANTSETGRGTTSAVGCFPNGHSPYGLLDMSGNTWEWTISLWGKDWQKPEYQYPYPQKIKTRENINAPDEILRVLRGGSFFFSEGGARCAVRGRNPPGYRGWGGGFRVVVAPGFTLGSGPSGL